MTEAGVLVAFGMIAAKLGLVVLRVQTEFPDCEVLCEMEPGTMAAAAGGVRI